MMTVHDTFPALRGHCAGRRCADAIEFMQALDTREIHGYRPETGYRVFTQAALDTG
jgi:hypothetical protein